MSDISIPPKAVEAAARAVHDIDRKIAGEDQWPKWEELTPGDQRRRTHRATAAILAALRAWPEMQTGSDDGGVTLSGVYLPLNTENSDD